MRWSEWLHAHTGRTDGIALVRLMGLLFEFLTLERKLDPEHIAAVIWRDYRRGGRRDKPGFLKHLFPAGETFHSTLRTHSALPKRQARHATR
jgi:hypothetical protein